MNKKEIIKKQKNEKIDLFWKAREFKPWDKSTDWYWTFWIITFIFIFILNYFFNDYIFSILVFLIAVVSTLGHRKQPAVFEYRINNDSIIMNNGSREIFFDEIEEYNIDLVNGEILINTKKKMQKLIRVPFEFNHNIAVIDRVLSSKIKKNEELHVPFLERLFERVLGF